MSFDLVVLGGIGAEGVLAFAAGAAGPLAAGALVARERFARDDER